MALSSIIGTIASVKAGPILPTCHLATGDQMTDLGLKAILAQKLANRNFYRLVSFYLEKLIDCCLQCPVIV